MRFRPVAFEAYVRGALQGKIALWRTLCGLGAIVLVTVLFAAFVSGLAIRMTRADLGPGSSAGEVFGALQATPRGIILSLAVPASMWAGVWLAVRGFQGRRLASVLGSDGRLSAGDFRRGTAATLLAGLLLFLLQSALGGSIPRSDLGLGTWLWLLLPMVALIAVQSAAEEVVFRGYLMQSLAARFRSPIVWALLPNLVFVLLHWDGSKPIALRVATLVGIAAFAAAAVVLVLLTGNLAASMGVHFANNLVPILVLGQQDRMGNTALFAAPPADLYDWSAWQLLPTILLQVSYIEVILLLLLHPRSPLRVAGR